MSSGLIYDNLGQALSSSSHARIDKVIACKILPAGGDSMATGVNVCLTPLLPASKICGRPFVYHGNVLPHAATVSMVLLHAGTALGAVRQSILPAQILCEMQTLRSRPYEESQQMLEQRLYLYAKGWESVASELKVFFGTGLCRDHFKACVF